jgi:hypothetical protein
VFAAVCVLLAALGHVLMSGTDVPAWVLAAGFAATGTAGWCLAGRERGLPLIVTVVVAVQAALHEAFSLAQSSSGGAASSGMKSMHMGSMHMGSMHMGSMHMGSMHKGSMPMHSMDMGHMDMGSMHMGSMHMGSMPMDSMDMGHMDMGRMPHTGPMAHSMDGWGSSYGMLAAHLLAALLTGLWLAYGEKAAFRILRAVAARLAAPLRLLLALPPALDRPRVHPRRPRSDRAPSLRLLVHAITTRGPPAGTAVV